jgi:hypothetical protein
VLLSYAGINTVIKTGETGHYANRQSNAADIPVTDLAKSVQIYFVNKVS